MAPLAPFVPRTRLIWIVAAAAAVEALLEGGAAFLEQRNPSGFLWGCGAFLLFGVAGFVENVKAGEVD